MRPIQRTLLGPDLRDALALAAAIGLVGVSFGALAAAAGVPPVLTVALSVLVFAGGSQFLLVAVLSAGGGVVPAVLGGLLLNARHLPFGLAMAPVIADRWPARLIGAHFMIDESVAFAKARGTGPRARRAFWLSGLLAFVVWNVCAIGGMLIGAAVPDPEVLGVDAAFPAALGALLLGQLRHPETQRVALVAVTAALAATPFLPAGVPVLLGLAGLLVAGRAAPEEAR
ncbi:Predicted branched-chain amino acid permease (azaleucine resistance) [Pseudonocardia thermophila]|uniref:Predicted branched-chain amino acid permease (Azaleucine resistance) n=1 Tax=Pseudonocardia thermophila TaxID=1848 RepID=A0A1M6Z3P0_PSETH|nr:AzlC family ABC transporter permease [Pseudonocardia thermophila]SHL25002.1 Predicted branched-chain amino acid permease (azaleucine resistance) [Pseudonocardia thermophila]